MPDTSTLIDGRNQIGKELATLDFANLIGGPLNAVVEAQAKAALTTVNFIKEVAFDKEGKARQVNFNYTRSDGDGKTREYNLSVPFLTMLPIPYIAVKKANIAFNAKITSTVSASTSDTLQSEVSADASLSYYWFARAKLQTKVSYQKTNSSAAKEERTYDLSINVEACNDEMPAGTERLLTILEQSIGESKGPEVFMLKLGPRTAASNTVEALEEVPVAAVLPATISLNAVENNKEIGAIPFTVERDASDKKKLTCKPDSKHSGAFLATTVNSITVRGKEEPHS